MCVTAAPGPVNPPWGLSSQFQNTYAASRDNLFHINTATPVCCNVFQQSLYESNDIPDSHYIQQAFQHFPLFPTGAVFIDWSTSRLAPCFEARSTTTGEKCAYKTLLHAKTKTFALTIRFLHQANPGEIFPQAPRRLPCRPPSPQLFLLPERGLHRHYSETRALHTATKR